MEWEERLLHHSIWLQTSSATGAPLNITFACPFLVKNVAAITTARTKAKKKKNVRQNPSSTTVDATLLAFLRLWDRFVLTNGICTTHPLPVFSPFPPHSSVRRSNCPSLSFVHHFHCLFQNVLHLPHPSPPSTLLGLRVKFMSYPGKMVTQIPTDPKNRVQTPGMLIAFKSDIWMASVRRALIIREYSIVLPTRKTPCTQRFVGPMQNVYQSVFKYAHARYTSCRA